MTVIDGFWLLVEIAREHYVIMHLVAIVSVLAAAGILDWAEEMYLNGR